MIWKSNPSIDSLNATGINTMVHHIGIEFIEVGDDYLIAKMPVDHRTIQPMCLLHGGASVALAETIGSVASVVVQENPFEKAVVGVEINANHLSSAREGYVFGKVTPIKVGRKIHVWNITITDGNGKLICISRLTTTLLDKKTPPGPQ